MADSANEKKDISAIAKEIQRLKSATIEAANKRERIPQPLFWSLFNSALSELRQKKERDRILSELLDQ